jgi:hypothetical protein
MSKLRSTSRETDREKKEKEKKRLKRKFANTIKKIFLLADFSWIDSENHQFKIGLREIEIDAIFYYENIVLICEYTSLNNDIKDHVRKNMKHLNKLKKISKPFLSG